MDAPLTKSKLIKGATGDWEVVIGLEVHAQVTSQAKLFSGASTEFGGEPNSHVSLVDAAMPGMLPVINEECVAQAVRTGLGLKAKINLKSVFDRKNYFYPDLPQGYQISQYKSPIVGEGEVVVDMPDGETVTVGIERLHLEQDAGKSLHDQHPTMSFVDLNRSGVALMEIVSKPDLRSAEEAKAYVAKLRTILRYLGTCDGDMEKGNLRADVNVSVRRPGEPLGTRCEIKNVNSIRFIGQAIELRGAPPDRHHRGRRQDRAGDAAVRSRPRARRARCAARRRRTTTATSPIPTCCRSSSTPAYVDDAQGAAAGAAGREEGALHARLRRSPPTTPTCWSPSATTADFFEAGRRSGRDAKAAANWVINELARPPQQGRQGHRRLAGVGRAARRDPRPDRGRARSPARSPRTCSRSSGARAAIRRRSSRRAA